MTYLTPEQASAKLPAFNADWYREQLRKGRLRGSKVGGRWLIEESAIDEMVEKGSNEAPRRRRRRRVS